MLQIKLDQPVSDPASPREISNGDPAANLSTHIQTLRSEVTRLRNQLAVAQQESEFTLPLPHPILFRLIRNRRLRCLIYLYAGSRT